eukprot:5602140-Prymnesium_polylepis.1
MRVQISRHDSRDTIRFRPGGSLALHCIFDAAVALRGESEDRSIILSARSRGDRPGARRNAHSRHMAG